MGNTELADLLENAHSRREGATFRWLPYLDLDDAISLEFFKPSDEGELVYLDMEPDVIERCATRVGLNATEFVSELASRTRALLAIDETKMKIFSSFDAALNRWSLRSRRELGEGRPIAPPPVIALLALLTFAAEQMGESNSKAIHHNNYYSHLFKLLDVPKEDQNRFESSFRASTERYWDALNQWLEAHDGRFGFPTAYTVGHRFIGLPISQALVRAREREQLKSMFAAAGLMPGQSMAVEEMAESLNAWISQVPSPATKVFQKLWSKQDNQTRISELAIGELQIWDGISTDGTATQTHRKLPKNACTLVMGEIADFLGNRNFEFGFAVAVPGLENVSLNVADGDIEISVQRFGPQLVGAFASNTSLQESSLLEGVVLLTTENGEQIQRRPRSIVPLYSDQLAGIWREFEHVQIGVSGRILVQNIKGYVELVAATLETIARPGFTQVKFSGEQGSTIQDWVLFEDVQILMSPRGENFVNIRDVNLGALVPRLRSNLAFSGGFRMPGRAEVWSSDSLPEVVITYESDDDLELYMSWVELTETGVNAQRIKLAGPQAGFLLCDLNAAEIDAGNYRLEFMAGGAVLQTRSLRVRDSNSRDETRWNQLEGNAHFDTHQLWPVFAEAAPESGQLIVDGAFSNPDVQTSVDEVVAPTVVRWSYRENPPLRLAKFRLPELAKDSCVLTGAHKLRYPTTLPGGPEEKYQVGVCLQCGFTKRDPATAKLAERIKRNKEKQSVGNAQVEIQHQTEFPTALPAIEEELKSWRPAISALSYTGTGNIQELRGLARKLENSSAFEREFIRTIDQLGLIEVGVDENLKPISYEVAATCMTELATGAVLLTGAWGRENIDRVFELAEDLGGSIYFSDPETLALPLIEDVEITELHEAFEDEGVYLVRDAAFHMIHALPKLSDVLSEMPRQAMPLWSEISVFDPVRSRWVEAQNDLQPGAYRITNDYNKVYLVRTQADIDAGQAVVCDVDIAKHFAAAIIGTPLIAYDEDNDILSVPMGALLPGLYGRAATLCEGVKPRENRETFSIEYGAVTRQFADALMGRLF